MFLSSCTHLSQDELTNSLKSQFGFSSYSTVQNTPGAFYAEKSVNQAQFSIEELGNFLLSPGDYSIPVMTYCVKSSSSSPKGHTYTLDQIEGRLAIKVSTLPDDKKAFMSTYQGEVYEQRSYPRHQTQAEYSQQSISF